LGGEELLKKKEEKIMLKRHKARKNAKTVESKHRSTASSKGGEGTLHELLFSGYMPPTKKRSWEPLRVDPSAQKQGGRSRPRCS